MLKHCNGPGIAFYTFPDITADGRERFVIVVITGNNIVQQSF